MNKVFIILEVVDLGDSIEGVYRDREFAIKECNRLNEEYKLKYFNSLMNMPNPYTHEKAKEAAESHRPFFYVEEYRIL